MPSVFKISLFIYCTLHSILLTAQTRQVQYLSGTDSKNTVAWNFWCTGGRKSGAWSKIQVPSHWEQQGFGGYNYGRDYVTYGKNFRFEDEKGIYKHKFSVPSAWKNKTINIVFEGSMTDTDVKINGKTAGITHQGSFYRFKYNITDKLDLGKENELEVMVSKMSADESVNNAERLADYWVLGGIFRPVYLEAVPKEHIEWTSIDAKADGTFAINVYIKGVAPGRQITIEILDNIGKVIGTATATTTGSDVVNLKAKVNNPLLWTAETPSLYRAKIYLRNGKGNIYQLTEKFGFRTIEVRRGDGIYLNGTKIKMKGVNRHVWWPETGRCVNPEIDLMDVKLIKEMNMNAVRCSHYPPDKSFLTYCDSLGLYVLDELAGWQKAYSTKAGTPLVKEMVTRDANHPSIILWSNGNEGGHNAELDDDYAHYDLSKRTVIHAHHRPNKGINGIDCNHYEDYYSTQKILADTMIYMPTEFLHAQDDGGGGAGLADFWELHWNAKKGAGGFVWALVDEGIVRTDFNNVIDVNGVNAPDGIVGPHREKEGSFYAIKEIYSPIKITLKDLPVNFTGEIPVENRFHFTDLKQCTYTWQLINFHKPTDFFTGTSKKVEGNATAPSIAPTTKGVIKLTLPSDWKNYDALSLAAFDPFKNELYRWVWKAKENATILDSVMLKSTTENVEVAETDSTVTLKAKGISVSISKKDGKLAGLANDFSAKLSFKNGPVLVSGNATFTGLKHYKENAGYVVEARYTGNLSYIKWAMQPNGWVTLEYEYSLTGDYPFAGVSFSYPENFVLGAKWLGNGPTRVWKNRLQGATLNVWENKYNTTHTGSAWLYPEFKGYFSDIVWMEINTVEGKFTTASPMEDLYVRLFDFYGLSGVKPHPELPVGNISFLDQIPPIGTKLALNINYRTSSLGPLSEPNKISGSTKRIIYFYFGTPPPSLQGKQFSMPKENVLTD